MRRPVVITAPFATPEDVARSYGIPKRRANELRKMVEESMAKKGYLIESRRDSTATKNGASNKASHSHRVRVTLRTNSPLKPNSANPSPHTPPPTKPRLSTNNSLHHT